MAQAKRNATPVDWLFAPDWLAVEQACFLSGWDTASILEIVDVGGADLNLDGLIEERGRWGFQEARAQVLHLE